MVKYNLIYSTIYRSINFKQNNPKINLYPETSVYSRRRFLRNNLLIQLLFQFQCAMTIFDEFLRENAHSLLWEPVLTIFNEFFWGKVNLPPETFVKLLQAWWRQLYVSWIYALIDDKISQSARKNLAGYCTVQSGLSADARMLNLVTVQISQSFKVQ